MTTFITVHGTGDGPRFDDEQAEPQWWRPESEFCAELLAEAGKGAVIEPFVWTGVNDEVWRRAAAEALLKRLRRADDLGERVHLIGHSHGGSVIALALRFAAADGRKLSCLCGFTTIGTPFLSLRLKLSPWDRFGPLGKALLTLLIPSAALCLVATIMVILGAIDSALRAGGGDGLAFYSGMWFAELIAIGGGIASLICLGALAWLRRSRRGLLGRGADRRLMQRFRLQWRGHFSRHDEAVAGLAAAAALRTKVFDRTVARAPMTTLALIVFLLPIVLFWSSALVGEFVGSDLFDTAGTPYERSSWFGSQSAFVHHLLGPAYHGFVFAHQYAIDAIRELCFGSGWFASALNDQGLDLVLAALFPVLVLTLYVGTLFIWLLLAEIFAIWVVGPIVAAMLNASIRNALLDRAFGAHMVPEIAAAASPHMLPHMPARPLPDMIDRDLLEAALAGAGDTFRAMRQEIFAVESGRPFDPMEAAMRHLSWNELVHTGYFRVPSCRSHLAAEIAAHARACGAVTPIAWAAAASAETPSVLSP